MPRRDELTDEQWALIEPLFPRPRVGLRGRPQRDTREVMNGVLWILRTGARWQDLPERYPPYQTCHRRFAAWVRTGVLEKVLKSLTRHLRQQGDFDLSESFIDGSFVSAKKGGAAVGKTKRGKGTKLMAVANRVGAPIAIHIESASPHKVTLVEATIDGRFTQKRPERLIGDKAYDSDNLDRQLAAIGIEMIAPHRDNRTPGSQTQDGRPLRRYRRRWRVERLFAWLQNFRRLVTRYEYKAENFPGFVHLGCMIILMRTYF